MRVARVRVRPDERSRASLACCALALAASTACGASRSDHLSETGGVAASAQRYGAADVATLGWLIGHWETDDVSPTGEVWQADGSDRLEGAGYRTEQDCSGRIPQGSGEIEGASCACETLRTTTERLEIIADGGRLLYVASPVDQPRTEFVITELDAQHFVAENPRHDFPTRIVYTHEGGALRAVASSAERRLELSFIDRRAGR